VKVAKAPASQPQPSDSRRTLLVTVVFIDIVDYSMQMVFQQIDLKTKLNEIVSRVLESTATSERIMLDTGDGAALCFLGDPEDALTAASNLRAATAAAALPLRIGINLGPVRIIKDVNGRPNVVGDGINDAQRVMGFAQPNQILVSRSYFEVLSRLSQEYSQIFSYVGLHRDKHVREHEVYEVAFEQQGPGAAAPAREPAQGEPVRLLDSVVETEFVPPAASTVPAPAPAEPIAPSAPPPPPPPPVVTLAPVPPPPPPVVTLAPAPPPPVVTLAPAPPPPPPVVTLAPAPPPAPPVVTLAPAPPPPPPVVTLAPAPPLATAPSTSAAPERFAPGVLTRLETTLAHYIGPLARVIVRKAAASAVDVRQLCRTIAASVPEAQQAEFATRIGDLADLLASGSSHPVVASETAPPKPAQTLSPDIIAKAAERLTAHLGPVAKVIVRKAAEHATDARDLYERIAQHIDDPRRREQFIAAGPKL
jgi:class 3 adenylate cyclase